jgi:hypothetical protein
MQERRKVKRTRVLKGAKLRLRNSAVIDCVVRDLTNIGAGVEVVNTMDLPEEMDLTFNDSRTLRPCRRVWRKINKTGVEFI